jgi:hypothetical protein
MVLLVAETASPEMELKSAHAVAPSAKVDEPPPASVVTKPAGVIARTRWLLESPTYRLLAVTAIANG